MDSSADNSGLQPVKASLVADLIELLRLDLSRIVKVELAVCVSCKGAGVVGDSEEGQDVTCPECGGVGAVETFVLDMVAIQSPQVGRYIEQWELKQGRLVPKFRGKTQAFAQLTKLLGFDKAVLEVAASAGFLDTLSDDMRSQYVAQVRELALAGAL